MTIPLLNLTEGVPSVDWDTFRAAFMWQQGEHVALIGPTGAGKTTLALNILSERKYVTVLATKPEDETLERFGKEKNYKVLRAWKSRMNTRKYPRRILWPDASSIYAAPHQKEEFQRGISEMYASGGWCIYGDELWILANTFGMASEVKTLLMQGRSIKLSAVFATQRPAWVPLEVYDQSTHLFFWRDNDEANLSRISGIGAFASNDIRLAVQSLAKYEVLYVNTRDETMYRTMPPPPKPVKEVK